MVVRIFEFQDNHFPAIHAKKYRLNHKSAILGFFPLFFSLRTQNFQLLDWHELKEHCSSANADNMCTIYQISWLLLLFCPRPFNIGSVFSLTIGRSRDVEKMQNFSTKVTTLHSQDNLEEHPIGIPCSPHRHSGASLATDLSSSRCGERSERE